MMPMIFISRTGGAAADGDITTGLVLWYKFDEGTGTSTTADSSGNGFTGTLNNSPSWVTGQIGPYALSFNGSTQYVNLSDIAATQGVSKLSFSAWVKVTTASDNAGVLVKQSDANNRWGMRLGASGFGDNNDVSILMANGANTSAHTTGDIISAGVWNHWCLVYDGTQPTDATKVIFYLNASVQTLTFDSGSPPTTTSSSAGTIQVAKSATLTPLNGIIDDVRVYTRALSATDVATLYAYR